MVRINGVETNADGMTLAEYLKTTDFALDRIAVELGGKIVPKSQYESQRLCDGDSLEIVGFVGGG